MRHFSTQQKSCLKWLPALNAKRNNGSTINGYNKYIVIANPGWIAAARQKPWSKTAVHKMPCNMVTMRLKSPAKAYNSFTGQPHKSTGHKIFINIQNALLLCIINYYQLLLIFNWIQKNAKDRRTQHKEINNLRQTGWSCWSEIDIPGITSARNPGSFLALQKDNAPHLKQLTLTDKFSLHSKTLPRPGKLSLEDQVHASIC